MDNLKISILASDYQFFRCFNEQDRNKLSKMGWNGETLGNDITAEKAAKAIAGSNIAITSWGSLKFEKELLDNAPELKMVCHAAGSVKPIVSDEIWTRGIKLTSSAAAISIGVAEHSLGLILSTMKNCYTMNDLMKSNKDTEAERENIVETFGITVGVVGCGFAGSHLVKLLNMFEVNTLVYDPFKSEEEIKSMGAQKAELDEIMSKSSVVALHAPELPSTRHMINKDNLKLLPNNAIIVNTARGSLINEDDLIAELKKRPIRAALDVTDPEPPLPESELRTLPNVILTPHIAGVAANNIQRIGHLVVEEIERFIADNEQKHEVTQEMCSMIA